MAHGTRRGTPISHHSGSGVEARPAWLGGRWKNSLWKCLPQLPQREEAADQPSLLLPCRGSQKHQELAEDAPRRPGGPASPYPRVLASCGFQHPRYHVASPLLCSPRGHIQRQVAKAARTAVRKAFLVPSGRLPPPLNSRGPCGTTETPFFPAALPYTVHMASSA